MRECCPLDSDARYHTHNVVVVVVVVATAR
jgi:hypothetical protein